MLLSFGQLHTKVFIKRDCHKYDNISYWEY